MHEDFTMSGTAKVRLAITAVGKANTDDLVVAAGNEGWTVIIADGLDQLQGMIASEACDAVVLMGHSPRELPSSAVHELLGYMLEIPVFCVFPGGRRTVDELAMLGLTLTHVWDAALPPQRLIEAIREETSQALSNRPEYVLICVDDDAEFLASMRQLLTPSLKETFHRLSLDMQFYVQPEEVLEAAHTLEKPIAAVISDQVMPHIQGLELLSRVKKLRPDTQKVLLTGYAGIDSAVRAVNDRLVDKYLTKPVEDPADFLNIIEHLVREFHLRRVAVLQRQSLMAQFDFIRVITGASSLDFAMEATSRFLLRQIMGSWTSVLLWENDKLVEKSSAGRGAEGGLDEATLQSIAGRMKDSRVPCIMEIPPAADDSDALTAVGLMTDQAFIGAVVGRRRKQAMDRNDRLLLTFVADVASITIGRFKDRQALEDYYVGTMASLMDVVEAKDRYTRGHTDRVVELAIALARRTGMDEEDLKDLQYAAALHDLGKLAVPESILGKAGKLLPWEYDIIKEHPARADTILAHLKFLDKARMIIRSHHERYDGSGYPDGLAGEEILLGGRILAVVDSYDAMTSTRPYRTSMAQADALDEIARGAGSQFDPRLASAFIDMMKVRLGDTKLAGAAAGLDDLEPS
jgi:response regulator RpfG family c-di-GMP phosphodiesterase